MLTNNPIILKELLQAARQKKTFLLRTGLPLVALVIVGMQLFEVLDRQGQDWRAIAGITRSFFVVTTWIEFIVFSLCAYAYAATAISAEWQHKTMEVLCASSLSTAKILYGKLIAILAKVFLIGLALLPVIGIWLHLGHMPREMVLGSSAILFGSTLFFGAMAILQAVLFRPGKGYAVSTVALIFPYFLITTLLDVALFAGNPLLEAAIGPRALHLVLRGAPPTGYSIGGFAALSLGIHLGIAALAMALAPTAFRRTLRRQTTGKKTANKFLRRLAGRRPPMGPFEDPIVWQEKGPSTAVLRKAVWLVFGCIALFMLAANLMRGMGSRSAMMFLSLAFGSGSIALALPCYIYGGMVFAREKSRGRAKALVLTGIRPSRFLWAKVRAAYKALFITLVIVTFAWVMAQWNALASMSEFSPLLYYYFVPSIIRIIILGPAQWIIIAMVFSLLARSSRDALLAILGAALGLWIFRTLLLRSALFYMGGGIQMFLLSFGVTAALLIFTKRWKLWHAALLWIMTALLSSSLLGIMPFSHRAALPSPISIIFPQAISLIVSLGFIAGWFWLGKKLFEGGMTNQPVSLGLKEKIIARMKARPMVTE